MLKGITILFNCFYLTQYIVRMCYSINNNVTCYHAYIGGIILRWLPNILPFDSKQVV